MPYTTLTLDIETAGGRPEDADRDMRINWKPASNWKPETIGKRYLEMLDKKKERLALIDGSPVISLALRGVTGGPDNPVGQTETRCLHCLYPHDLNQMEGAGIEGFATEREMLLALRGLLTEMATPDTCLVGHNILQFDLPKLRMAYLRNGLGLPAALADHGQPVFDSMREWGKRFSATRDAFVSVADVLEILGVANHKHVVDGSQIEKLYAENRHDTIIKYNLLDVITEHDLFLRLTGQAEDHEATEAPEADVADESPEPEPEPVGAAAGLPDEAKPKKSRRKLD